MARTRAQDYLEKRDSIRRHAAELFAKFGYSATSISMIAKACGASKALLYHYYPDKEAVLFDLISAHLEELIVAVEAASALASPGEERLFAMSAALLEAYRDADAQHQVQISNLKLVSVDKQQMLRQSERRLVELFANAIAEAVPNIGRGLSLKPITMSLFGMLNWHYLWFREDKGLTRSDYARLVTRMVVTGSAPAALALGAEDL